MKRKQGYKHLENFTPKSYFRQRATRGANLQNKLNGFFFTDKKGHLNRKISNLCLLVKRQKARFGSGFIEGGRSRRLDLKRRKNLAALKHINLLIEPCKEKKLQAAKLRSAEAETIWLRD